MAQKYIVVALVAMLLALAEGCEDGSGLTYLVHASLQERPLKIGSINMASYTTTKNNNATIKDFHKQILERYDVVLVIGAVTNNMAAIDSVFTSVKNAHQEMTDHSSPVVGNVTIGEKYKILFNESRVTLKNTSLHDPLSHYEYDPYFMKFESTESALETFGLVAVRINENAITTEINSLNEIYDDVQSTYDMDNLVFLGDYQADCDIDPVTLTLKSNPTFKWLIPDEADTLVDSSLDCANSRILTTGNGLWAATVSSSARVFRFDIEFDLSPSEAEDINDEFPVEVLLYGKIDGSVRNVPAIYMIEWKQGTAVNPDAYFPTDGVRIPVAAGFEAKRGSGLVIETSYTQANVKKSVECREVDLALDDIAASYPSLITADSVTVWKQHFNDKIKEGFLPGVEQNCVIDIEYRLVHPYPYTITVSSVAVS